MEGRSEREEQILTDLVNIPRDTPVPPLCSSSSPPTPFLHSHRAMSGPAGTERKTTRGRWSSSDNDTTLSLYSGLIKKNPDNSLSAVCLGPQFFLLYVPLPRPFLLSPTQPDPLHEFSPSFLRKRLHWSCLVHTEIVNADPNCANSSSSIALITRLFTEALKKPLNCHS